MSTSENSKSGMFPSVMGSSPMITSEKLHGASNYKSWAASVRLWFKGQGHLDHLHKKETDIPVTDRPNWIKVDAQLCALLWNSLDPHLLPVYQSYETCYEVWNKAASIYSNDIRRYYDVLSNLVNLKHQDLDITTYVSKIESLKHEFRSLMPATTSTEDQEKQWDKFFMVMTLINLRPDLDHIRDQILGGSTVPTLDDVLTRLIRISSSNLSVTEKTNAQTPDTSALLSQNFDKGNHGGSGRNGPRKRPQCTHCHKLGHTRDRCWNLHGRPPRTANIAQTLVEPKEDQPPASVILTGPDYEEYLRFQTTKQSSTVASVAHTGNSVACLAHSSLGPWVLDSGASDHMSGNKNLFSHISNSFSLPSVTLANGSKTAAKGIGQAIISPSITLNSVIYVPECPFNLISISQLTRTLNCSITFTDKCVTLQDRSTGQTIGVGRESQGLYYFPSSTSPVACSTTSPSLIHSRLGHPSLSKLQQMVPSLSTLKSFECESCQLGKQARASFPRRVNNRAASPFQLVHTDVWGPCRVLSHNGFQYFVTFIDDYSRCTWLYLMKNRSEVFSIFQSFCAEIKNQFGTSISILRSDNAREYFSTQFQTFLSSQGILHQSSCAHTPQQNGVAERKNRHLIEIARTLLLHSNVPFRFWGDAILTACYLINRMPSSVLQNQIPHSILFPSESLYPLPPRVFGCTCFVQDLTPGKDKLAAKSIKCIFLGYSRLQKGYRCYSPTTKRCYISADVTFFETSPLFPPSTDEHVSLSKVLPFTCLDPSIADPPLTI